MLLKFPNDNSVRQGEMVFLSGYQINKEFIIQFVPNITNITYGRGVGYILEQESFESDIESISSTKIRKKLRDEGKIE